MYYEEEIINGVKSWRNTPNGEWTAFTPQQLTNEVTDLRACLRAYQERMNKVKALLDGEAS